MRNWWDGRNTGGDDASGADGEAAAPPASVRSRSGTQLIELQRRMMEELEIRDRRHHMRSYSKCFVGSEAVDWLVANGSAVDRENAVRLGNMIMSTGTVFHHVTDDHAFKDAYLFYRFYEHEQEHHGSKAAKSDGSHVSWSDYLGAFDSTVSGLQPRMPDRDGPAARPGSPADAAPDGEDPPHALMVAPLDGHNVRLLDAVHPPKWVDPLPSGKYNMVVIGAGAGGLVTAAGSAGVGAKVAIIEENLMGGDCLNVGCVPSKALIASARAAADARRAAKLGVHVGDVTVDFPAVMERVRKIRADIAPNDSASRFADLGVDVFIGRGRFTGKSTVEVNGQTLTFASACVATGGRPNMPKIPGLADAQPLTNETIFNLTSLPPRLGVIGAGPIGLELAQCFARFGSKVTVFCRSDQVLSNEDRDAADIVRASMQEDGVEFVLETKYQRVEGKAASAAAAEAAGAGGAGADETKAAEGEASTIRLVIEVNGEERTVEVDELLVAAGRKPNVEGMGLDAAGIEFNTKDGVVVNDKLQTTNKNVYAVGDVCQPFKFTHVADWCARIVIRNALFFGRSKLSNLIIPWTTYTEPEIAHVGLYERDLKARGDKYSTFTKPFNHLDRAMCDGEDEGFVKVHAAPNGSILGATVVARDAGNIISEITLAMTSKAGLGGIATTIHPYPTTAEAVFQVGGLYNKTRMTSTVKTLFNGLMRAQR